jgi:hypothetical protein
MKFVSLLLIFIAIQQSELPFKEAFYVFDFARGFVSSIFEEVGATAGAICMEDGDEVEDIVMKAYDLINNFNINTIIADAMKLVADAGEIYNDCTCLPAEFSKVVASFEKMIAAFENDSKSALLKMVIAVVTEGTNIQQQINELIGYFNSGKYLEAGDLIGDIVAFLTIKLY